MTCVTRTSDGGVSFIYMRKTIWVLLAVAYACAAAAQTPPQRLAADQQVLWNTYFQSVYDSAVYQRNHVRQLYPLQPDPDGNVLVVTMGRRDGNVGDPIVSANDGIWVTAVPEVQTICRTFTDVTMQLRQLLGLPPDNDLPRVLVLRAKASDLFRPSPYADTMTKYPCSDPANDASCGNAFPSTATPAHMQWMATSSFSLHAIPYGYPWTHLGYTYNWAPGKDRYGASEYVIRAGASATITQKSTPAEYCAKP
jgi:hypothetical protein